MKTSNKLLLGIFLAILILTTTVQLMVLAKYKRGDYTAFRRDQFFTLDKFTLSPVRFVSITGLGNCVLNNSNSTRVEVQDYKNGEIVYEVKNDTLFVNAARGMVIGKNNADHFSHSNKRVNLYLPAAVPIKAAESDLRLAGAPDSGSASSYNVQLEKGSYLGVYNKKQENTDMYFNRLQVACESSNIQLDDHIIINSLQLDPMVASEMNDKNALIKSITINADDKSNVRLSGKNIKAIK